ARRYDKISTRSNKCLKLVETAASVAASHRARRFARPRRGVDSISSMAAPVRTATKHREGRRGADMAKQGAGGETSRQAGAKIRSVAASGDPAARPASRRRGNVRDLPDGPPDETGLTPRQRRVLEVIRDAVERRGYPPSVREIGESVGLTSTSSVAHQLKTLEAKGFLRRDPNRPRAVEVLLPGAP